MRNILTVFFILISGLAWADEKLLGKYNCKVKTNYVLGVEDGVINTFSGFKGQAKVGDQLTFSITGFKNVILSDLRFKLDDPKRNQNEFEHVAGRIKITKNGEVRQADKEFDLNFFVSENVIYLDKGSSLINFTRYFKTDYSLVYVFKPIMSFNNTQVLSADCRASKHAFPDLIEYFK